ncbi:MAG TPA: amino acid permease [Gemmatimonadaceae bacterium]|nr:amino acid permease [Gemmatimonadaceae bacterium]
MSERQFGSLDGAALVVANVIGSGIFTVPSIVAGLVPNSPGIMAVWILGGALALAGALAYAELATRSPRSGGEYVYLREAFGPIAGFLSGWTSFVAGFSGAIAASAAGIAAYLARIVPALGGAPFAVTVVGPVSLVLSPATAVGVGVILLFTAINLAGVSAGRAATSALAMILVVGIAFFAVLGFAAPRVPAITTSQATIGGIAAALVPVMFTYAGWNAAAYVSGQFRNPLRDVPRALALGTAVVTVLYVAINWAFVAVLSPAGVARTLTPAEAAARAVLGGNASTWLTVLVLAALGSSISAMIVTGPRIYAAMAEDGALPKFFGATRGSDRRPVGAILTQSAWSCALVLTGTFEALVTYTGFAIVLFAGAAVFGLFVIRHRTALPVGAYSCWGYPLVPAAFVIASAFMLIATIRFQPRASLAGLTLIAAGIPIFLITRARSRAALAGASTETRTPL